MRDFRRVNPLAVYGMLLAVVLGWLAIAGLLTAVGIWGAVLLAAALFGVPLLISTGRKARDQRVTAGLCGRCGYDLRATEERCPECGAPLAEEILRRRRLTSNDDGSEPPVSA